MKNVSSPNYFSNETNWTITNYPDIEDLVDPVVLSAYKVLLRYFPVVLAVLSLIGNGLLFAVLSRPNNRHTTTSMYLMALAIADLAVTARNFAFWLDLVCGVTVDCGFHAFLDQSSMSISSWLLAVISFERVLSVAVPLKVKFICKPLRAKILIALVVILLCAYGAIYGIFFTKKKVLSGEEYTCIVPEEVSSFYTYYFRWISQCLHSIFPLCIIFFNSVTIVTLLSRRMSSSTAARSGRNVTINIVLINIAFVVTRFPSNFLYLYQVMTEDSSTYLEKLNYALILECSYQLRDLNSVLNFYIYFLAGRKFRQDTKQLISRIICCGNKGNKSGTNR